MEAIAVAAGLSAAVVVALRKRLAWSGVRAAQLASGLVIPRPKEFARKRNALISGGIDKIQIATDFDRTLTAYHAPDGSRGMSCHGVIESAPHLTPEYKAAAAALFDKYFPIETSANLTKQQKTPLMYEWYHQGHDLLIQQGFRREHVESAVTHAVQRAAVQLRAGMPAILTLAATHQVPTLVFSAGIGNVLTRIISKLHKPLDLHHSWVVSNFMNFREDGSLEDFAEPLIHMFNKNTEHVPDAYKEAVKQRPHVLLMGDSLGDVTMADGQPVEPDIILRIGFLNAQEKELLPLYEAAFDVVVLRDGPADVALDILEKAVAVQHGGSSTSAPVGGARVPSAASLAGSAPPQAADLPV